MQKFISLFASFWMDLTEPMSEDGPRSIANRRRGWGRSIAAALLATSVAACSSIGASGPRSAAVRNADGKDVLHADIKVIELTDAVARRIAASSKTGRFSEVMNEAVPDGTVLSPGDVIDISIWEAPPGTLFGTSLVGTPIAAQTSANSMARNSALPEQMVDISGRVTVPFVGAVLVAGRTTREVEREIMARLAGKANAPQALVRLVRNASANVTVVGDVVSSTRFPLSPRGERLLDALAGAGGVKQPVGKTTIQIARDGRIASEPLEDIIKDPAQNVRLKAGDVITAYFQPYSFTALGAIGNNAEIAFESTGLTLAQALGRVGGLQDNRADVKGVFIFRLETPDALDPAIATGARMTPDGRIPVIYRVDLRNPATFFVAQGFAVRNKDVLYVSNSPLADLQKFVGLVSQMAFSIVSIGNAAN